MRQSEISALGTGNALLVDICHRVGARQFLAQGAARKYVDAGALRRAGIDLDIVHVPQPVYPQLWGEFIPNLSIWDLLFNCGPQAAPLTLTGRFSSPLGHHSS